MQHDEISKAFADLTPEQLIRDTSALSTATIAMSPGEATFNRWVEQMLDITQRRLNEGAFDAFAVLRNETSLRTFVSDGDETPDDWADRLAREALSLKAQWFYAALLAPARATDFDDSPPPIERTVESIEEALNDGLVEYAVCWVADRCDRLGVTSRAGFVTLDKNGRASDLVEGVLDEGNVFGDVLWWAQNKHGSKRAD